MSPEFKKAQRLARAIRHRKYKRAAIRKTLDAIKAALAA